jgi:tetratricopeptide (TPR) repeat protein
MERAQALTDYLAEVVCYTTPCVIHMIMRQDYDQAAQGMYELLNTIERVKDPTAHYLALGYTMWVESRRGNHHIAAEMLAKAHDIIAQVGALLLNDTFVYVEAELAFNDGRFDEALVLAQPALKAAITAGSLLNQVRVHRLIGQTLARLDSSDWADIDSHLATALDLSDANNMRLEAADLHSIWGQLLADRGNKAAALEHLQQALAQFTTSELADRCREMQQQIERLS